MIAYFVEQDKIINTETVTYAEIVGRTDRVHEPHVIVHFVGGGFLEFSSDVTLHELYTQLTERS